MPFTKITRGPYRGKYRSPSGRVFNKRQVARYYSRGGTFDAAPHGSLDPTGTTPIRRRFIADFGRRFASLKVAARSFLLEENMLGLGTRTGNVQHLGSGAAQKLTTFTNWFSNAAEQVAGDGTWMAGHILNAYAKGAGDAARRAGLDSPVIDQDQVALLQQAALTELQGILGEMVRQAARGVAMLAARGSARNVYGAVASRIDKIGVERADLLVNWLAVKAHADASLANYAVAGVTHVGISPEHVIRREQPLTRDGADAMPWLEPYRQMARRRRGEGAGGLVGIQTAGDDLVCSECEELEAGGPYTLTEAMDLIPAHPGCRCAWVIWDEELTGDYNPYHDPATGRFASGPGGIGLSSEPPVSFFNNPIVKTWMHPHGQPGAIKTINELNWNVTGVSKQEADAQARDAVIGLGDSKREYVVLVQHDGTEHGIDLAMASGDENSVAVPQHVLVGEKRFDLHHNHPKVYSLSTMDIQYLNRQRNLTSIAAHNGDATGGTFKATLRERANDPDGSVDQSERQ